MQSPFEAISILEPNPRAVVRALEERLQGAPPVLLLYFASSRCDFAGIAAALAERFPGVPSAGCTTCGEVGPAGCTTNGVSVAALRSPARAAVSLVEDLSALRFEQGGEVLARLTAALELRPFQLHPARHVLLTFTDGLSGAEEVLIASLSEHAPGIPLVGGSAGDDFRFERTFAGAHGRVASNAAAVVLLEPNAPFHPFHLHHYHAEGRDTVVTEAEPARRIVRRLDGFPASRVLAELLQLPESALHANPRFVVERLAPVFGFRAAGTLHLRSVMNIEGSALLMGGAVETGMI
ncbi:MAG TPA: FIST N-terminal domain-containing protein, partial [Polyangiales bacterium]|nr:FIST N-terminal domain-containing protein [Polyangiales bacterium]